MLRELMTAAVIAGAAMGAAPLAAAHPNDYYDPSGRYKGDVPGMNYEANLNAPCDNFQLFTFGRGRGGEPMQCHWIPNQWPPVYTGFWVSTFQLFGVQQIGTPCPGSQSAAQAPDGRPLRCLGEQGWQPGVMTGTGFWPY